MEAKITPVSSDPRTLVEFVDYSTYFGSKLYPKIGKLALIGVVFLAAFGVLDWAIAPTTVALWMTHNRVVAGVLLSICGVVLIRSRTGWGPARLTLILGVAAFLVLTLNYVVLVRQLELVAFSLVFFMFGLNAMAPLLRLRDYLIASVASLVVVGATMGAVRLDTSDFVLAALFAPPLQIFLGATLGASQRAAREQYDMARQNYLLSTLDMLSQLMNRRTWYEAAEVRLADRRSPGAPCAFLMLDIDHFKVFNDTWGHACGDAVIREVSRRLVAETRNGDLVGRLGGEEFGILLPETSADGALETAERIRRSIESARLTHAGSELTVTVSLGIACGAHGVTHLDDLVASGDAFLYQAKRDGRNRVALER